MVQMVTAILVDDEELRKKKAKNVTKVLQVIGYQKNLLIKTIIEKTYLVSLVNIVQKVEVQHGNQTIDHLIDPNVGISRYFLVRN